MGDHGLNATEKSELRRAALARRRSIPQEERRSFSRRILSACRDLAPYRESRLVCCYVSFRDEVETGPFIREILAEGVRVVVPYHLHPTRPPLLFSELRDWAELEPSHFGILQPVRRHLRPIPTAAIPFFLVPGVAFDLERRRLGFGAGFYDRALVDADPRAVRVGLAFELQVYDTIPADPHDVPMDLVVTERRLIGPPPGGAARR